MQLQAKRFPLESSHGAEGLECADNPQCCTPEAVRVLLPGWLKSDAIDAHQCLGAVGCHEDGPGQIFGPLPGILADQILGADRVCDRARLSVVECVIATHEALQLGE